VNMPSNHFCELCCQALAVVSAFGLGLSIGFVQPLHQVLFLVLVVCNAVLAGIFRKLDGFDKK
jgi:hypothetical protein